MAKTKRGDIGTFSAPDDPGLLKSIPIEVPYETGGPVRPHLNPLTGANMKVAIDVKDRNEATLVKTAMADPTVKAFTLVMGALLSLPTDRARLRVMQFVTDKLDEQRADVDPLRDATERG